MSRKLIGRKLRTEAERKREQGKRESVGDPPRSAMFSLSARDEREENLWMQLDPNRDQNSASFNVWFASRREGEFLRRKTLSTDAIRSRALPLPEKASHRQLTLPAGRDKLHAGTTRARAFSVNFPYHEARDRVRPE
jgi:hypothetical protein